jgi:hypothetical protein
MLSKEILYNLVVVLLICASAGLIYRCYAKLKHQISFLDGVVELSKDLEILRFAGQCIRKPCVLLQDAYGLSADPVNLSLEEKNEVKGYIFAGYWQ